MAKKCFCGCGRTVPFGRKRIANSLGDQMRKDIELFKGSVERTPDPEHDADLRRLIATGIPLRDKLRDILHGTLDRDDYPRDQGQAWLKEAIQHRKRMATQMIEADFAGWSALEQSQLLRTGAAAPATIVDVSDTGMSINDNPRVELTLRVTPSDGTEPFDLRRKLVASRVKLPRVGERLTVFYDPDDLSKFTFKNDDVVDGDGASTKAADPVDQISRLHDLHRQGALSEEEFAEAKQRLLADL